MRIKTKAPMRVCFGGGLLDIFPINLIIGGYTVNAAINKFVTIEIQDNDKLEINAEKTRLPGAFASIYGLQNKKISINEDITGFKGFGQSAALGVALGYAVLNDKDAAAAISYEVENKILGIVGGYQDQIAASKGGFNIILNENGTHKVETITNLSKEFLDKIKKEIVFFSKAYAHSGIKNEEIVEKVMNGDKEVLDLLNGIKTCTENMVHSLKNQDADSFIEWVNKEREYHENLRKREGPKLPDYEFEFVGVRKIE